MERSSQRAVQLFRRTRDFLVRTAPTAAYGTIGAQVEVLGQAADRISAAAVELGTRIRAARMGTQQIRQRARALRLEFMRPVARIASQRFANDPALRTALGMPLNVKQPEALVAAAHAMANAADAQKTELMAGGLPADFVEQLRRAAASVLQAIDQRAEDVARRSAAAAAVHGEVVRGRSAMSVLDAMVGPRFEGEFEVSAEWRSLMRQGRLRRVVVEAEAGGVVPGSGEPGPGAGVAA